MTMEGHDRLTLGVPLETAPGERRVALVPSVIRRLVDRGLQVLVEPGAGSQARIRDAAYTAAGATLTGDAWHADVVVKVAPPSGAEVQKLRHGAVLIGFLAPATAPETATALAARGVTAFAMESIPRISRAQTMDALTSQATVVGYRGALLAAEHLTRFFPMLTTAAGTVQPARVLVMGVGVAGLQALAVARRLGARTTGYDVRSEVAVQVRSVGAAWLEVGVEATGEGGYARELTDDERTEQQRALAAAIGTFDVVITTAQVPGRPAPTLVTAAAVSRMRPGSVIVDLAADGGGNCQLSTPGDIRVVDDVTIIAPLNLPSSLPEHASQLYARNVEALVELMLDGDPPRLRLDFEDEVLAAACLSRPAAGAGTATEQQQGATV